MHKTVFAIIITMISSQTFGTSELDTYAPDYYQDLINSDHYKLINSHCDTIVDSIKHAFSMRQYLDPKDFFMIITSRGTMQETPENQIYVQQLMDLYFDSSDEGLTLTHEKLTCMENNL